MNFQFFWPLSKIWVRTILLHLLAWVLFILYELLTLYFAAGKVVNIWNQLLFYGLNIGLFYVNAYIVLDFSFKCSKRPYLVFILLLILELGTYIILKYGVDYYLEHFRIPVTDTKKIQHYVAINLWRGVYFLGFSTLYWSVKQLFAYRQEMAESEKRQLVILRDKADVERNLAEIRNAYLQQQINPHFLFNTLNFVYNTVYKYSPDASKVILQLSDILRFSLEDHDDSGQIELVKEVEQIRNVIEINRVRYDYELHLLVDIKGDLDQVKIIPLALLTLVENVFKHGNLKNILEPALITLSVDGEQVLRFTTWNLKKAESARKRIKSIGIQNTLKRLQYAYGNKFQLMINDLPESYGMELLIEL